MSDLKPQEIRGIAAQSGCRIMIEHGTGHELYCFNSLTEFADNLLLYDARRTQPEATAPAQDLSAAILAIKWDANYADKGHQFVFDEGFQAALKAAAALTSSANALSAGDRVDAERYRYLRDHGVPETDAEIEKALTVYQGVGLSSLLPDELDAAIDAAILQTKKGDNE